MPVDLLEGRKERLMTPSILSRRHGIAMPNRAADLPSRAIQLLPCLSCRHGKLALEEIAGVYLSALHGAAPSPRLDDRGMRFLPRMCCRQPSAKVVDPEALVA